MEYKKPASSNGEDKEWPEEIKWQPESAEELVGILKSKRSVKSPYDESGYVTILSIEDAKGDLYSVWGSRTALKDLIRENDAALINGRLIAIKCGDKVKTAGGFGYIPYELGLGDSQDAEKFLANQNQTKPVVTPEVPDEPEDDSF